MAFSKLFKKRQVLTVDDLIYLHKLLSTSLSFNESVEIISNNKNKYIFDDIVSKLNDGTLIENIIPAYLPDELRINFNELIINMSFLEALSLSLTFYDEDKSNQNILWNSLTYPIVLLFISIISLYFFDLYGIDTIFSLVSTFSVDLLFIKSLRIIFSIVIKIIFYLFLISCLIFIYYRQAKRIILFYIKISSYFPNSLMNIYYCSQFMKLFLICLKKGYKSKQVIEILKHMKSKPIISFLAFHIDDSLNKGNTLKESVYNNTYYDSSLSSFIKIANCTNDFENIIITYVDYSKERIIKKLKKYTLTIQLTTYIFIGFVVLFIYQILFLPMQAIMTF